MRNVAALTLFLSLLASSTSSALPSPPPVSAASCNDGDVQSAIDAVADQGVVLVPAGTCTWTKSVTIGGFSTAERNNPTKNKSVILKGAGIDRTIIIEDIQLSGGALGIDVQQGKMVRVTGFTFDGSKTKDNRSTISVQGPPGEPSFRIDHNKFRNVTERGIVANGPYGLIDHNTLIRIPAGYTPTLISVFGDAQSWSRPQALGTANAVYIEDNTFIHNLQANGAFDMYTGARYVFRHNTVHSNGLGHHGFDSSVSGIVNFEIYNNTFINASPTGELYKHGIVFEFRSGSGVLFNNTVIKAANATNDQGKYDAFALLRNYRSGDGYITNYGYTFPWDGLHPANGVCDGTNPLDGNQLDIDTNDDGVLDKSSGYPCRDQIGRTGGFGPDGKQTFSPVYSWNNNYQGVVGGHLVVAGYAPPPPGGVERIAQHIKEGRDYFNGVARPGYTPYEYPHPLATVDGSAGPLTGAFAGSAAFASFKNVFNPKIGEQLSVVFNLFGDAHVTLTVYDRIGHTVETLLSEDRLGGRHEDVSWDGKKPSGELVAAGIYLLVLKNGSQTLTKKVVVVK